MMSLISWNSRFDPPWRNGIETNFYSSSDSPTRIHNSKFLHVVNQLCILNWQIMQTYTAKVLSELMKNEHSNPGIFLSGCHFSLYILIYYYCYFLIISFQQILDDQSPPYFLFYSSPVTKWMKVAFWQNYLREDPAEILFILPELWLALYQHPLLFLFINFSHSSQLDVP